MIKTQTVAVCDICGKTELARVVHVWGNEREYGLPMEWTPALYNPAVHLCPTCSAKLLAPKKGGVKA